MTHSFSSLASEKIVQAVFITLIVLGFAIIPNVVDARCPSRSASVVALARSVVPVVAYCVDAGGTLQAPIKPEGGGLVCGGVGAGDEWPVLSGGGANVWRVSSANGEMWSYEVYSNASTEPSVVCTIQGCDTTDVPIVVPVSRSRGEMLILGLGDSLESIFEILLFVPGYIVGLLHLQTPSSVMVPVTMVMFLLLPPFVAVFLARYLFALGVHLYLRCRKPVSFDRARYVKRVRTPIEILFCVGAYFLTAIALAGLSC